MSAPKDPLKSLQKAAIASLTAQTSLVRDQQRQIKAELAGESPNATQKADLKRLSDQVGGIGRSVAALLAEARKQAEAMALKGQRMTAEEKVDDIIKWLPECPIADRGRLSEALTELGTGL